MAGVIAKGVEYNSDILFDLNPDDDVKLRTSSLMGLINYGQEDQIIKVLGVKGEQYSIKIALLWDDDYIDMLKKTSSYSSDE